MEELPLTPRLFSPVAAAEYLGIGLSTFTKKVAGRVPRLRCGRRVLYTREALDEYVDQYRAGQDIAVEPLTRA